MTLWQWADAITARAADVGRDIQVSRPYRDWFVEVSYHELGAVDLGTELGADVVARGAAELVAGRVLPAEEVDLGAVGAGADRDGEGAGRRSAEVWRGEHGAGAAEAGRDDAADVQVQAALAGLVGHAAGGEAEHGEAEEVEEDEEDGLEHLGGLMRKISVDLRRGRLEFLATRMCQRKSVVGCGMDLQKNVNTLSIYVVWILRHQVWERCGNRKERNDDVKKVDLPW
ncbi:uncharacterized protein PG986_014599 [Apiospora aurea]|uniref:Uncharacterized protein n=1 Tax=Apiospora aurea TaxID=335848 RepID=A0ABR1PTF5_9PEZI